LANTITWPQLQTPGTPSAPSDFVGARLNIVLGPNESASVSSSIVFNGNAEVATGLNVNLCAFDNDTGASVSVIATLRVGEPGGNFADDLSLEGLLMGPGDFDVAICGQTNTTTSATTQGSVISALLFTLG
jgi:hypothetical protein